MLESPKELNGLLVQLEDQSRQTPDDVKLMLRLARLYLRNGSFSEAEQTFERLLKLDNNNAQVMVELAHCLIRKGAHEDAHYYLERSLEIKPGMFSAFIAIAKIHEMAGNVEKHVAFMMLAANAAPEKYEVRLGLADLLRRYGDINGSISQYMQILEQNPDLEAVLFPLATILMKQNQLPAAIEYLRRIVQNNPGAFDAHFNLGSCLLRLKKSTMAISHFKMAMRKPELQQRSLYLMAQCHLRRKDFDQAIVTLEKLVEANEDNIVYRRCLAETYEAAGEYDLAREVYRQLSQRAPERPEFMTQLALLMIRLKDLVRAEKTLKELFGNHPGHVEGHRILGDLYVARGSYKEAIEEYRRTLMVNENHAEAFVGLAGVYRHLANDPEEHQALQRVVELGKEKPEYLLRLGQLERQLQIPTSLDRFRRVSEVAPDSNCAKEAEYYLRYKAA